MGAPLPLLEGLHMLQVPFLSSSARHLGKGRRRPLTGCHGMELRTLFVAGSRGQLSSSRGLETICRLQGLQPSCKRRPWALAHVMHCLHTRYETGRKIAISLGYSHEQMHAHNSFWW